MPKHYKCKRKTQPAKIGKVCLEKEYTQHTMN